MQQELIAGDSLNQYTSVAIYPASAGWTLKFRLVPRTVGGSAIELTAAAEGEGYRTTASAAVTATWSADNYGWTSWVEKAGEVYSVESGQIVVRPNPRTVAVGTDLRSQAEKALADAKTAFAAWSPTMRRYRIGEREMEFTQRGEILQIVSFWEVQVKRERREKALAEGRPDPRNTYVRLNRE